jgi:hypothetical protein
MASASYTISTNLPKVKEVLGGTHRDTHTHTDREAGDFYKPPFNVWKVG